jgi:zinc protease
MMKRGTLVRAALSGAALVSFPVPLRAAAADLARSGALPGGGGFVLRPLGGASVAAIALWFRAPAAGFDTAPAPGLGRLAGAAVAASQPITGTSLATYVAGIGGRLAVAAYPESVAISTLVPAAQAAETVRALTRAYFAPVLSDAGLTVAKRDQVADAANRAELPQTAIEEALYGALFASGPAKYPTFGGTTGLIALTVDHVRGYAERAFRPGNAILVLAGAIDDRALAAAIPGREGAAPGAERPQPHRLAPGATVERRGSEPGFGLAWAGPPIADERAATALDLVADRLFSPDTGTVQRALRSSGTTLTGTYVTFHDPGVFIVSASGGDVAAARRAVEAGIEAVRTPLEPAAFSAARRTFTFHILSDQQTPSGLADTYGWYAVEGNPAYAPGDGGTTGRYLSGANALTPELVAATVRRYLGADGARVTVSGPARS